MSTRRRIGLCLCAVVLLAACLGFAPESDRPSSPDVEYQPFAVSVDGPSHLGTNETGTVSIRTTLKTGHPEFLAPQSPLVAVENVTLSVGESDWVRGNGTRRLGSIEPGESVTSSFTVCSAVDRRVTVRVVVNGTVRTENTSVQVDPQWAESTARHSIAIGTTNSSLNGTATPQVGTALQSCWDDS